MPRGITDVARQFLEGQPAFFRPLVEAFVVFGEDAKTSAADFNGADSTVGFDVLDEGAVQLEPIVSTVVEYFPAPTGTGYELVGNQPVGGIVNIWWAELDPADPGFIFRARCDIEKQGSGFTRVYAEPYGIVSSETQGGDDVWTLTPIGPVVEALESQGPDGLPDGFDQQATFEFTQKGNLGSPPTPSGGTADPQRPTNKSIVIFCWAEGSSVDWQRSNTVEQPVGAYTVRGEEVLNRNGTDVFEIAAPAGVNLPLAGIDVRGYGSGTLSFTANPLDLGVVPPVDGRIYLSRDVEEQGAATIVTEINDGVSGWLPWVTGDVVGEDNTATGGNDLTSLAIQQTYQVRAIFTGTSTATPTLYEMRAALAEPTLAEYEATVESYAAALDPLSCEAEFPTAAVNFTRDGVKDFRSATERLFSESAYKNLLFRLWWGHPEVSQDDWVLIDSMVTRHVDVGADGIRVDLWAPLSDLLRPLPEESGNVREDINYTGDLQTVWLKLVRDDAKVPSAQIASIPSSTADVQRLVLATEPRQARSLLQGLDLIAGGATIASQGVLKFVELLAANTPIETIELNDYQILGLEQGLDRAQAVVTIDYNTGSTDTARTYRAAQQVLDSLPEVNVTQIGPNLSEASEWIYTQATADILGQRLVEYYAQGVQLFRIKTRRPLVNLELGDLVTFTQDRFLGFNANTQVPIIGESTITCRVVQINSFDHTDLTLWPYGVITGLGAQDGVEVQQASRQQVTLLAGEDFRPVEWPTDYADVTGAGNVQKLRVGWQRWAGALTGTSLQSNETPRAVCPLTVVEGIEAEEFFATCSMDNGPGKTLTLRLMRHPLDGSPSVALATLVWEDEPRTPKQVALSPAEIIDRDATYTIEAEVSDLDIGESFSIYGAAIDSKEFL